MAFRDWSEIKTNRIVIESDDPVPLIRPDVRHPAEGTRGRLVVRFGVGGHPCQWVTHGTTGTKSIQREYMRQWKLKVEMAATIAMRESAGRGPRGGYRPPKVESGYVEVWADFVLNPSPCPSNPTHLIPDRTNLAKALEDAMQGIVYTNDVMVIGGDVRRAFGPHEGAVVEVWSVDPLVVPSLNGVAR